MPKKLLSATIAAIILLTSALPATAVTQTEPTASETAIIENETEEIAEIPSQAETESTVETVPTEKVSKSVKSKDIYSVGESYGTVDKTTGNDNTGNYEVVNVYTSGKSKVTGKVTYYKYATSKYNGKKNKYSYYTDSNHTKVSGKFSAIVLTMNDGITFTFEVDESSLVNKTDDVVGQGSGSLSINKTSKGTMPEYYYQEDASSGLPSGYQSVTYVASQINEKKKISWAPWRGARKTGDGKSYTGILDTSKISAITIGSNLTSVSANAFNGFGPSVPITFSGNTTTINENAFRSSGITKITWGGVKTIKQGAFSDCDNLTGIVFSNAITFSTPSTDIKESVSDYNFYGAFEGCDKLASINFGDTTTVGIKAFYNCDALKSITWGKVSTVKAHAFNGCDGFENGLDLSGSKLKTLEPYSFRNLEGKTKEVIISSSSLAEIGELSITYSSTLTTLTIKDTATSLTTIGKEAFRGDTALKTVNFNLNKITTIKEKAFMGCSSLVCGKVTNTVKDTLYGYTDSAVTAANTFVFPSTIKTIGKSAFRNCTSLRVVTWADAGTVPITTIDHSVFYNDYALQYFVVSNKLEKIRGRDDNGTETFGAFAIDDSISSSKTVNYNFWLGFRDGVTNIKYIGDRAFQRANIMKGSDGSQKGVALFRRTDGSEANKGKGKKFESTSTSQCKEIMVFPKLTYVGNRAFFNSPNFTGILQFGKDANSEIYPIIGSRAFSFTNLTDLFVIWNPTAKNTLNSTKDGLNKSSAVGSSNQYVSASTYKGYTRGSSDYTLQPPSGFVCLSSIENKLLDLWADSFTSITGKSGLFDTWTAEVGSDTAKQPAAVPELSYGVNNSLSGTNELKDSYKDNTKTHSYLKTETKWVKQSVTANETVTFGYKNEIKVDFVFVVDNSPSMDKAANNSDISTDNSELGNAFNGTYNASKTMNAFAQIVDISKRVLGGTSGNSVSVISENGNNNNELSTSSKLLSPTTNENDGIGMTDSKNIEKALFHTDNGYEDGGVTNYSSGLSRAYYLINSLRSKYPSHKQVVIMITDGNPTYWNGLQAVTAGGTSFADYQVNGYDWAAAIRNDTNINNTTGKTIYTNGKFKVHSYSGSKVVPNKSNGSYTGATTSTEVYDNVAGLGVNIYGILVGKKSSKQLNYVTNGKDSKDYVLTADTVKNLAEKLSAVISNTLSEDYNVVIPFNNNFELRTDKTIKISYAVETGKFEDYYFNVSSVFTKPYKIVVENNKTARSYSAIAGQLKYDSSRNAIVWNLSSSQPYVTYKLNFDLKYKGTGRSVTVNSVEYRAVNDNDSSTGHNAISTSYSSQLGSLYGAYAYLSASSTDTSEKANFLMNKSPAIYLPIYKGSLSLTKLDDKTNAGLANAKYTLYFDSSEETDVSKIGLSYSDRVPVDYVGPSSAPVSYTAYQSGSTSYTILTKSSGAQTITNLPYGTYFLVETDYPKVNNTSYTDSQKNNYVYPSIEGKPTKCIKVTINSSNTSLTTYNTPLGARVWGVKRYLGHRNSYDVNNLPGATIALYSSFADASAGNSSYIATSVTNNNGEFSFNVNSTGTYYIREIKTPKSGDYQISRAVLPVTVSDLSNDIKLGSDIFDPEYGTITVKVDSSDAVREDFEFTLIGNASDYGSYPVTYTGTSNGDGTYTFKVPVYNIYSQFPGNVTYKGIKYTLTETGYKNSSIPSRYLWQEFSNVYDAEHYLDTASTNSSNHNAVIEFADWDGTSYAYNPAHQYNNKYVKAYNISARIYVHNYDGEDQTTPLQSSFTLDGEELSTAQKSISDFDIEWSHSYDSSGNQYIVSNMIDVSDLKTLNISFDSTDSSYFTYAFYDDSGVMIGSLLSGNEDTTTPVPSSETVYLQIIIKNDSVSISDSTSEQISLSGIAIGTVRSELWHGEKDVYLTQTDVEDGYNLLSAPLQGLVHGRTTTIRTASDGRKYLRYDMTVYNNKTPDYPYTGGHGYIVHILSAMSIFISAFFYCCYKRKNVVS